MTSEGAVAIALLSGVPAPERLWERSILSVADTGEGTLLGLEDMSDSPCSSTMCFRVGMSRAELRLLVKDEMALAIGDSSFLTNKLLRLLSSELCFFSFFLLDDLLAFFLLC